MLVREKARLPGSHPHLVPLGMPQAAQCARAGRVVHLLLQNRVAGEHHVAVRQCGDGGGRLRLGVLSGLGCRCMGERMGAWLGASCQ